MLLSLHLVHNAVSDHLHGAKTPVGHKHLAHSGERGLAPSPVIDRIRHVLGLFLLDVGANSVSKLELTATTSAFQLRLNCLAEESRGVPASHRCDVLRRRHWLAITSRARCSAGSGPTETSRPFPQEVSRCPPLIMSKADTRCRWPGAEVGFRNRGATR